MLSSISPLGQRARGGRYWRATTAYLTGTTLAGAALAAAMGAIGALAGAAHWHRGATGAALLAAAAAAAAVADLTGRRAGPRRQVDERWLVAYRDWVHGFGYGMQLGAGVLTIVSTATILLTGLIALVIADPVTAAAVGATFGLARGAMLLSTARVRTAEDLRRLMRRHAAAQRPAAYLAVATAAGTALVAAAAAVTGGW
jgi:hypothetical protein